MAETAAPAQAEPSPAPTAGSPEQSLTDVQDKLTSALRSGMPADSEPVKQLEALRKALLKPVESNEPTPETPAAPETPAEPAAETPEIPADPEAPANPEEPAAPGDTPADATVSDRIRLGHLDEAEKALVNAANMLARARGISFKEAWATVSAEPEALAAQPTADPYDADIAAREENVSGLQARLDELEASEGLYGPEAGKLLREHSQAVAQLEIAKFKAETAAEAQHTRATETVQQQRQTILQATATRFPGLADKTSAIFKRAQKISAELANPDHPDHNILFTVNAPKFIGEMAAEAEGVAPVSAKPSVPSTPPAKISQPVVKTAAPASGAKHTQPPPPTPTATELVAQSEEALRNARMGLPSGFQPMRGGPLIRAR